MFEAGLAKATKRPSPLMAGLPLVKLFGSEPV
jgi:hypothetical protein